jgi:hypothetical protein
MVVDTGTAILILGAFVLPGFITLILRERLYIVRGEDAPFERLLSTLLYSALIYGVLLVAAHRLGLQKSDLTEFHEGEKPLGDDLLAASAILLLLPGLIAVVGSRWMRSKRLRPWALNFVGSSEAHSPTSAWNQLFSKQSSCLIRATLSDGRVVGGFYDEKSFTAKCQETVASESIVSLELYSFKRWKEKPRNSGARIDQCP